MRKIIIVTIMMAWYYAGLSQTKIATNIYMQNDPSHVPVSYKNIVFKSNGDGLMNDCITQFFKKNDYQVYNYYSLFPNLRKYSQTEIDSVLKANKIDLQVVIDVQTKDVAPVATSFTAYNIGGLTLVNSSVGNMVNLNFLMFMFDMGKENPFVRVDGHLSSEGEYRKRVKPLTDKFITNSLNGLYKSNVLVKPN